MQNDAQMCWKRILKLYANFKNTTARTGLELPSELQKLFALLSKLIDRKGSRRQSFEHSS